MKRVLLLALAMTFLICSNLLAIGHPFADQYVKQHYDFGVYTNSSAISWTWAGHVFDDQIFDYNNDWAPITYPDVSDPNYPSPGIPDGELFDIEGSKFGMDDDYLYFAVTSSFGYGTDYEGFFYETGDFFFGFNGMDATFGVDMDDGGIFENTSTPFGIPDVPMGYHNNIAVAAAVGPFAIDTDNSNQIGGADGSLHMATEFVTDDTYVLEMRLSKGIFTALGIDFASVYDVSLRQTMSCGNDYIEHTYDTGVIPEPTTLTLLGLGLLGAGLFGRRKK